MASKHRSPLRDPPLRVPGQSVQESLDQTFVDSLLPILAAPVLVTAMAINEWVAVWRHSPRMPWLYSAMAAVAIGLSAVKFRAVRAKAERLRLGRDGERSVGQLLEGLRLNGAQVFHDLLGKGFNVDHVVISTRGIYAIETKTWSKPERGSPRVTFVGGAVRVGQLNPDDAPVKQAQASAAWVEQIVYDGTGKRMPVHGVLLFPGWFVERMPDYWRRSGNPWVLEPKAFRAFFESAYERISESDVALAAYFLSRYIRANRNKGSDIV